MNALHGPWIRLGSMLVASVLLAACALEPAKPPPQPAVVTARPEPPPTRITPLVRVGAKGEPWASMVASFQLHDCADAPLIRSQEAMYTRYPDNFERLLRNALPLMVYVHKELQAAGIPGEFVMLPMLESSYQPGISSHFGAAAGMWQLMPRTARLHGVQVTHRYDGRRDPVASTKAAIAMLKSLHERFGDWRLADMAYNAGPYAIHGKLSKHGDIGSTALPGIHVSETTRKHLARLMALSCILRKPKQFHVQLPKPKPGDELVVTQVPAGTRLDDVAEMAEMPVASLRKLNPGYRGKTIPSDSPRKLLLPAACAQSLVAALTVHGSESVAQVEIQQANADSDNDPPLPVEPAPPADVSGSTPPHVTEHRVHKGDTLWSIAHHYHVSVSDLKRWNHLHGNTLHPGQTLQVQG